MYVEKIALVWFIFASIYIFRYIEVYSRRLFQSLSIIVCVFGFIFTNRMFIALKPAQPSFGMSSRRTVKNRKCEHLFVYPLSMLSLVHEWSQGNTEFTAKPIQTSGWLIKFSLNHLKYAYYIFIGLFILRIEWVIDKINSEYDKRAADKKNQVSWYRSR